MEGVHPDLSWAVSEAAKDFPHKVNIQQTGGLRDEATQRKLLKQGATKTMRSRHREQDTGYGHATDIAIIQDGKVSQDGQLYDEFYQKVEAALASRGHTGRWGGNFKSGMKKDYGHIELHTIGQTK
jgi:peptidoglycan L-alanyl-D-glutamate endopeptidase CwlK